ncbi:SPOR domain-containing protein [Ramlibacter tataouinensis]|uniref:SPOR domain-containing protein n=1 Tax=Ramlibacter tataouinensis (strain ATCC BAA-407 / DSM 14655 / LMG 21543 / TTB310) TaxID=365046 RepID=F5Y0D0_RAMTT|nr:SPOR domain-containing protein [Ramlibacter tataouinensis]AEG92152.1 Conserved hypothetical protein [Ramlibacter tataouinensis TTB310]
MAFFKFRKGGDEPVAHHQPESVEAMRRRARHRLIGAAVLVLAGVIGFPLLFDTRPRPVAVDIPIEIPDRGKTPPLPAAPVAPLAPTASASAAMPSSEADTGRKPATAQADPGPGAAKETEPPKPAAPAAAVAKAPSVEETSKARAVPDGKAAEAAADGRFVVQVGAFANAAKAREARLKVEKMGLKTYTHVADTKDGRRIRVRVGPFSSRNEADKAADKIKGLDMPATVLTL